MTILRWANRAYAHLASAIGKEAGSLALLAGEAMPWRGLLSGTDGFYLTLFDAAGNREVIMVTGVSGDTFTISRGQLNSIARAWPAGTVVAQRVTSGDLNMMVQRGAERTGTYNPHGVLVGLYLGEKYYDSLNVRHFINCGGTNWKLLTGSLLASEMYDDNGFPVSMPERFLVPIADINLGGFTSTGAAGYTEIDNGIVGDGAAPDLFTDIHATGITANYECQLTDPGGSILGIGTFRFKAAINGASATIKVGFRIYTGATPLMDQYVIGTGADQSWPMPFLPGTTISFPISIGPLTPGQAADLHLHMDITAIDGGQTYWCNEIEVEVD